NSAAIGTELQPETSTASESSSTSAGDRRIESEGEEAKAKVLSRPTQYTNYLTPCTALVPNGGVDTEILCYMLRRLQPELRRLASGETVKEVSTRDLEGLEVTLPNLRERQTLASLLSSSDCLKSTLRHQ